MNSSTNSPIGSHHWFNTLLAVIKHTGEYLKKNGAPESEDTLKAWGCTVEKYANELLYGFGYINSSDTCEDVLLSKYDAVNKCETAEQLKQVIISFADENGNIKGRRRLFKAERMASFVDYVISGTLVPEALTREFGIRQQALYIKYYEDEEKNKS